MKEEQKIELINSSLIIIGILSVFFSGKIVSTEVLLSTVLFFCGCLILMVKAVPEEKGERPEPTILTEVDT
jgi:hypothetical protein